MRPARVRRHHAPTPCPSSPPPSTRPPTPSGPTVEPRRRSAGVDEQLAAARAGGGERYVARHRERGKLPARERIELLVDRDTAFLELAPLAGVGNRVHGRGVVGRRHRRRRGRRVPHLGPRPHGAGRRHEPLLLSQGRPRLRHRPRRTACPSVNLVESGGADLPAQAELFIPGGRAFRDLTRNSAAGLPTVALVFGNSTAGGAYVPGMSDYIVMIEQRSKVFLGGPPLVKMATGEESTTRSWVGLHARPGVRPGRLPGRRRGGRHPAGPPDREPAQLAQAGPGPTQPADEPVYDPDELLGIASADPKVPFDPREVLARVVDGSRFDEFKPLYGASLVTGWASIHGYPIGVLANHRGVLFSEEAHKATQFIQLANQIDVPLVFLQNTTGYMVGKEYEQRGIIKHGAMMINAVSNSSVPHLTVNIGASYGAGNYGMCGRAYDPRFLFAWPNARSAVMGPAQLAGVLSIVSRQSAEAGRALRRGGRRHHAALVEAQIESESLPLFLSARLYDDGIIDPRDTRTVLGICLSVIDNQPIAGTRGYGVFRMCPMRP